MGDFVILMQFIGSVFVQVFSALGSVNMGEFSLLQIFISIIVLRIVIWFIARSFGITIDTSIQDASDRTREGVTGFISTRYQSYRSKYRMRREKNRIKYEKWLMSRRSDE